MLKWIQHDKAHHSPLTTILSSSFVILYSLLFIQCSLFCVQQTLFNILYSVFNIQYPPLTTNISLRLDRVLDTNFTFFKSKIHSNWHKQKKILNFKILNMKYRSSITSRLSLRVIFDRKLYREVVWNYEINPAFYIIYFLFFFASPKKETNPQSFGD